MDAAGRILDMVEAPVDSLNRERRRLESGGSKIINLGQAIPDFGPPPEALAEFSGSLKRADLHNYTSDSGLVELRQMVADSLGPKAGGDPVSADEIIITAGANHAFLVACSSIVNDGDAVGLLSPYFLNHAMTIQGIGGRPVELLPSESFDYDAATILHQIKHHNLKALTLVNPSNPTGKLFAREELIEICNACQEAGTWILADEVYRRFDYSGKGHTGVLSLTGTNDNAVVFGSFSKEFGMTGWRVGWLRVPGKFVNEFIKVQDYSIICAPHPGQIMALNAMRLRPDWASTHLAEYASRREVLLKFFHEQSDFKVYAGQGAFFVWFRPRNDVNSHTEAFQIMRHSGVCVMPGNVFGKAWTSWFRISYGTAAEELLMEGARRLVSYFNKSYQA